jgi:protein-L-isoaspartate(D-aspartate) O-methyltransferase
MRDKGLTDLTDLMALSAERRSTMVDCQVRTFDVTDKDVLARMLEVPREIFVPEKLEPVAYSDLPLEIEPGDASEKPRFLLPPLVLARLIQGAIVTASDKVLDVASGTGYTAALLAGLAARVVALESDRVLHDQARDNFSRLALTNVQTVLGPLGKGAPAEAPFNVIVINGAAEANLEPLFAQLKPCGRLVAILRQPGDPSGRASKAVCFDRVQGATGYRVLFDASAPVLPAFRREEQFTFA